MTYFNTILTFTFLLMHIVGCAAANASDGYVPVRNFSIADYSGSAQNWGCVQDALGRVYVANGYGMLCYDGSAWRRYNLPNYTSVRSLLFDDARGCIYAGGSEEFGYFSSKKPDGGLEYTSLSGKTGLLHPGLTEVWNIFRTGDKVWFQGDYHIFCYDGNAIKTYDTKSRITYATAIDNRVYVALDNGSILLMTGERLQPLPGLERLAGKKIVALLPYQQKKQHSDWHFA